MNPIPCLDVPSRSSQLPTLLLQQLLHRPLCSCPHQPRMPPCQSIISPLLSVSRMSFITLISFCSPESGTGLAPLPQAYERLRQEGRALLSTSPRPGSHQTLRGSSLARAPWQLHTAGGEDLKPKINDKPLLEKPGSHTK